MKRNYIFVSCLYVFVGSAIFAMHHDDLIAKAIAECNMSKLADLNESVVKKNIIAYSEEALHNKKCSPEIFALFAEKIGNPTKFAQTFNSQKKTSSFLAEASKNPEVLAWFMEITK